MMVMVIRKLVMSRLRLMRDRRLEQLVTDPNDYTLDSDDATPQKNKKTSWRKKVAVKISKS